MIATLTTPLRPSVPTRRAIGRRATTTVARAAVAAKKKYVCVDCGYVYSERKAGDWNDLPRDYKCPACTSGKRRFKEFKDDGGRGANNSAKAMAQRQQEILENGSDANPALIGGFLLVALGGAAALFQYLDAATTV